MGIKEVENLIHFWKAKVQDRIFLSPESVYFIEQTIKGLVELKQLKAVREGGNDKG